MICNMRADPSVEEHDLFFIVLPWINPPENNKATTFVNDIIDSFQASDHVVWEREA